MLMLDQIIGSPEEAIVFTDSDLTDDLLVLANHPRFVRATAALLNLFGRSRVA